MPAIRNGLDTLSWIRLVVWKGRNGVNGSLIQPQANTTGLERLEQMTLNHRVPGSSPGAPTIQPRHNLAKFSSSGTPSYRQPPLKVPNRFQEAGVRVGRSGWSCGRMAAPPGKP